MNIMHRQDPELTPNSTHDNPFALTDEELRPAYVAELQTNAMELHSLLKIRSEPTVVDSNIFIDIADHNVQLPRSIVDALHPESTLTDLTVEIGAIYAEEDDTVADSSDHAKSTLAFHIGGRTVDNQHLTVTASPITTGKNQHAAQIKLFIGEDEDGISIAETSMAEINQMFASVYLPNKLGRYEKFRSLPLGSPLIAVNVAEALESHANEYSSVTTFAVDSDFDGHPHQIEFTSSKELGLETISIHKARGDKSYDIFDFYINGLSTEDATEFDIPSDGLKFRMRDDSEPDLVELSIFINDLLTGLGEYSHEEEPIGTTDDLPNDTSIHQVTSPLISEAVAGTDPSIDDEEDFDLL